METRGADDDRERDEGVCLRFCNLLIMMLVVFPVQKREVRVMEENGERCSH